MISAYLGKILVYRLLLIASIFLLVRSEENVNFCTNKLLDCGAFADEQLKGLYLNPGIMSRIQDFGKVVVPTAVAVFSFRDYMESNAIDTESAVEYSKNHDAKLSTTAKYSGQMYGAKTDSERIVIKKNFDGCMEMHNSVDESITKKNVEKKKNLPMMRAMNMVLGNIRELGDSFKKDN